MVLISGKARPCLDGVNTVAARKKCPGKSDWCGCAGYERTTEQLRYRRAAIQAIIHVEVALRL